MFLNVARLLTLAGVFGAIRDGGEEPAKNKIA
jgi:hypothetical protein